MSSPQVPPKAPAYDEGDDELVLGSDTMVPQAPAQPAPQPEPIRPSDARRRWLTPETAAEPEPAPAAEEAPAQQRRAGSTLFERMASAGRAPARGDEKEGLDIPRFLHRQNNQ